MLRTLVARCCQHSSCPRREVEGSLSGTVGSDASVRYLSLNAEAWADARADAGHATGFAAIAGSKTSGSSARGGTSLIPGFEHQCLPAGQQNDLYQDQGGRPHRL